MEITVKDLIEYLKTFGEDTTIGLDKDGWMQYEIKAENPQQLIHERGLFHLYERRGYKRLILNN